MVFNFLKKHVRLNFTLSGIIRMSISTVLRGCTGPLNVLSAQPLEATRLSIEKQVVTVPLQLTICAKSLLQRAIPCNLHATPCNSMKLQNLADFVPFFGQSSLLHFQWISEFSGVSRVKRPLSNLPLTTVLWVRLSMPAQPKLLHN